MFASGLWENVLLHFNWYQKLYLISNLYILHIAKICISTSGMPQVKGLCRCSDEWDQGHSWSSVAVISGCLCRTLSALLSKSHVTGSGLLVPRALSFLLAPTSSSDPVCPHWCPPSPVTAGVGLSPAGLVTGTFPTAVPITVRGSCFQQGWLPLGPALPWSALRSCHGSTNQSWFQFHFPLAQRGVSYSWRCFFSLIILC